MWMQKATSAVARISNVFNHISMAAIFLVASIMFLDIALRLTVGTSILGTYEITEMGMIAVIFGALAYTQVLKGHVRVTMLVEKLPRGAQRILEGLLLFLTASVCGGTSYAGFVQAAVYRSKGATTAVLKMPYYPFAYFMAAGMALFTVALLLDAAAAFTGKSLPGKGLEK
jgi:TRAP-type C4-dicarboxylate transport system permease small subunit